MTAALTDRINDREVFMKGIEQSYYYEEPGLQIKVFSYRQSTPRKILIIRAFFTHYVTKNASTKPLLFE